MNTYLPDCYGNRQVRLVSLNHDIPTEKLLKLSNMVYAIIPDIPLKMGYLKVNIGHTLVPFGSRQKSHLFDNFGHPVNTDLQMSQDTSETMYIKALELNVKDREAGLRWEGLITAQTAYDMTTLPNKDSLDFLKLIKFNQAELSNKMYNKVIFSHHKGRQIIGGWDYEDIKNGKYSVLDDIVNDLFRVGAINHKLVI